MFSWSKTTSWGWVDMLSYWAVGATILNIFVVVVREKGGKRTQPVCPNGSDNSGLLEGNNYFHVIIGSTLFTGMFSSYFTECLLF